MAEFDAVVSGDIYVLAPSNDRLLSELLPFLCVSERFFEFAVETSAGSLSPRTNWKHLVEFEFSLPPPDQQRRIAQILWAVEDVVENWRTALQQYQITFDAFASTITMCGISDGKKRESALGPIPVSWDCVKLEEVVTSSAYGPRFPGSLYNPDGNARTVRTTDFARGGGINFSAIPAATLERNKVEPHRLISGDFLLSRSGEYAGLTALFQDPSDGQTYVPGAFLIRYRFNERLLPEFLLTLCCSEFGERFVKPLATGSAQPNISGTAFTNLFVPLPPVEEQRRIIEAVGQLRQLGDSFHKQLQSSVALLHMLVNRLFA